MHTCKWCTLQRCAIEPQHSRSWPPQYTDAVHHAALRTRPMPRARTDTAGMVECSRCKMRLMHAARDSGCAGGLPSPFDPTHACRCCLWAAPAVAVVVAAATALRRRGRRQPPPPPGQLWLEKEHKWEGGGRRGQRGEERGGRGARVATTVWTHKPLTSNHASAVGWGISVK